MKHRYESPRARRACRLPTWSRDDSCQKVRLHRQALALSMTWFHLWDQARVSRRFHLQEEMWYAWLGMLDKAVALTDVFRNPFICGEMGDREANSDIDLTKRVLYRLGCMSRQIMIRWWDAASDKRLLVEGYYRKILMSWFFTFPSYKTRIGPHIPPCT